MLKKKKNQEWCQKHAEQWTSFVLPLQSATGKTSTAQQRCLCLAKQDTKDFTHLYIYRWMGWNTEEAELRKQLRQSLQSNFSDLSSRAHSFREPNSIREQERYTLGSGHTDLQCAGARRYRWLDTSSRGGLGPVPLGTEVPTVLASTLSHHLQK